MMIKYVFTFMIIISILTGILTGNISILSNAALNTGKSTIELFLILLGSMAVWGGLMRIADKSGITDKISILFKPFLKHLFKGLDTKSNAFKAITMNITANLLGLGNAATPLGIKAMQELEKEDKTTDTASRNMVIFTVMNTASMQLLPTTIATLRLSYGSNNPMEILPAVLLTSLISFVVALSVANVFDKRKRR